MEVTEGNIRVGSQPVITIGDASLHTCDRNIIAKEILALVKRIGELREENIELKRELAIMKGEIL